MSLPDKHDPRYFRHYAKFAADGSVAAVVERETTEPPPSDDAESVYVEFTDLYPVDLSGVAGAAQHLETIATAKRALKALLHQAKVAPE